jgi:peroxiredoxin Q/BCP
LSDPDATVCNLYGVINEKSMYGKIVKGIERSTFVIDADGRVSKIYRKVKVAGHASAVLDAV